MFKLWLSWKHYRDMGPITLHWPWWISGSGCGPRGEYTTICAAIQAESWAAALQIVRLSFDKVPNVLPLRFITEKDAGWSPFNERFPRADWMQWPEA